jgi:hypothetical protein
MMLQQSYSGRSSVLLQDLQPSPASFGTHFPIDESEFNFRHFTGYLGILGGDRFCS